MVVVPARQPCMDHRRRRRPFVLPVHGIATTAVGLRFDEGTADIGDTLGLRKLPRCSVKLILQAAHFPVQILDLRQNRYDQFQLLPGAPENPES